MRGLKVSQEYDWTAIVIPESNGSSWSTSSSGDVVTVESHESNREAVHRVHGFEFRLRDGALTIEHPGPEAWRYPARGTKRVIFINRDGSNPVEAPYTGPPELEEER